jgi:hypothetical protein
MITVRHISQLRGGRPAAPLPWAPPRLTRAQLEAAVLQRPGTPANAPHIIDDIVATHHALDCIDARRSPDGTLSARDQLDYDQRSQPLARWFMTLGLYPASAA